MSDDSRNPDPGNPGPSSGPISSESSKGIRYVPVPTLRTGQAHPHPEPISGEPYSAVELMPGFRVVLLDQRRLPEIERYEFLSRVEDVSEAIRGMLVRGAPAIGICAAYGVVVAAAAERGDEVAFMKRMAAADALLRSTRPTAVNLSWALDRMMRAAANAAKLVHVERAEAIASEARNIHREDVASCHAMGKLGAESIPDGATILTHCNAGALATGGYGTALGVIRAARDAGKSVRVLATETRPYLQGARLTAWELSRSKIPVEVITDSMVGHFMAKKAIDAVIVGADRVAKNGDVANKIGTYGVACLAAAHGIPFHVAAPWSTVDLGCADGGSIVIEERDERELTHFPLPEGEAVKITPDGVGVRNPAFDVTPAKLVSALVTERGVVRPPSEVALASLAHR